MDDQFIVIFSSDKFFEKNNSNPVFSLEEKE